MLLVGYENDWKKSEWKPLASVRLAGKPFVMRDFHPQANQSVEVAAKASEQEPYSFWRSTVRTVRGEFYLISYNAVADEVSILNIVQAHACLCPCFSKLTFITSYILPPVVVH